MSSEIKEINQTDDSIAQKPNNNGTDLNSKLHSVINAICMKRYDLALKLAKNCANLATENEEVLMALSRNFPNKLGFWETLIYPLVPIKRIEKKKKEYKEAKEILSLIFNQIKSPELEPAADICRKSLLEAVRLDVPQVVHQFLSSKPDAINIQIDEKHNIIQLAVINRSEKVYKLIAPKVKSPNFDRTVEDSSKNNLLHLAGRVAPSVVLSRITGAALQLQRELQWREEVERLIELRQRTHENRDGKTPELVFTNEHADLVKEGEKWMKTTAESCSITAALVATIVFAAAITVPGGSDQETGIPLFKKETAFIIFAASDAISLYSAATALLVFLSILTTRFAEEDFLVILPRRLLFGLCLLLISTTAMMFAYSAIFFLVFCNQRPKMLVPLIGLSSIPIATMINLQLPLMVNLFQSTFSPIFGEQKLHRLFYMQFNARACVIG